MSGITVPHVPDVSAAEARVTLLLLTVTRWFPVGLTVGVTTLLALERGMNVSQLGIILAMQGIVVLGLELPTGGFADALGRRPVLLAAGVVALVSGLTFVTAHTFPAFVVALLLQGLFRALDSGPLEAWYVDTAQADEPGVRVERTLAHAGTAVGLSIASGALLSGALVAWNPYGSVSALELPYWVALGFYAVNLAAIAVRMRETRDAVDSTRWGQALRSARDAPRTVAAGMRTLSASRILRALVLVEVFWSVGMIAFETLMPIRLAELVGGQTRAGALMGPLSAAAWGLFAIGSSLAGMASRRIGVGWTALLARVLNGALIVVMGLTTGPAGLIAAFLFTYTLHGAGGPAHNTLLHREADPSNRATILSMNSMVTGGAYTVGLLLLGPLAQHTSTALAIIIAGSFSIIGAVLYLPAIRGESYSSVA